MKELSLKYGNNPHQTPARIFCKDGSLPIDVLNGQPGYINLLDALNAYQLVRELKVFSGLPAATSFKHVSPAGAALGLPLDPALKQAYFVDEEGLSPLALAYARARGTDRMSSFGDFVALSDPCDSSTARLLAKEVSDGIVAPGYTDEALKILGLKRNGTYLILRIDETYVPPQMEEKDVFGITFQARRNDVQLDSSILAKLETVKKDLPEEAKRDLLLALITLKYTQSNSVCYTYDGQTIGVGAGQQSRIHCTRLAGDKADLWWLRQHPKVLALPFRKDISRPERDNAIDAYLATEGSSFHVGGDALVQTQWESLFTEPPTLLSPEERAQWISKAHGRSMGSDGFFPFEDNVKRAKNSGVSYIAQPGGSMRDSSIIESCNRYGIAMAFTGLRLFHH